MMDDDDALRRVVDELRERISEHGWTAVHVMGDAQAMGWTYSIGFDAYADHPDVIISAMPAQASLRLIEDLARRVMAGERILPGVRHDILGEGYGLCFVAIAPDIAAGLSGAGSVVRGRPLQLLQVIWPDPSGRFPTDPDADPDFTQRQVVFDPHWRAPA